MKLLEFIGFSFKRKVQNWIRQEIVDDDPWDDKTFFPTQDRLDQHESDRLVELLHFELRQLRNNVEN